MTESFFGDAVMLKCTVAGDRELPGLLEHEVQLFEESDIDFVSWIL